VSTALASFDQNNRMTSTNERGVTAQVTYDASGNVTWDGVNYYLYDAESRICAVASTAAGTPIMTGYMYDADGIRVSKGAIQQWSCNPTTAQYATQTDYIIGPGGEQMSEYAMQPGNTMAWVHTNVWAAGRLLATYAQDSSSTAQQGLIHFYFDDPLGSRRAQTDYAGNLERSCGNLPYGDGETCDPTPTEHLFTNKERDAETGNDYFGARYFASTMGRFLSPDWSAKVEPVPYSKLDDPQTLNLYAYVNNNPLSGIDVDGHVPLSWGGFEDCGARNDCSENATLNTQNQLTAQSNIEAEKVWEQKDPAKFLTLEEAQTAGALADFHAMVNSGEHEEWGNYSYETKDGKFSYTRPKATGPPCTEDAKECDSVMTPNVPNGTTLDGDQHTHPWVGDDHQFDGDVMHMTDEHLTYFGYVAGPSSNEKSSWGKNPNVFKIDPNAPSVCKVSGPSSISSCN
jgi:RHS repeat-associated protein